MEKVHVDGQEVTPAITEGPADVFKNPHFTLAKARWVGDDEVTVCALCSSKFNQLRRKHHCRQCGRVMCNKCCKERLQLPQLGLEEAERVCESCRPVAELVTRARYPSVEDHQNAAKGLASLCNEPGFLTKIVELGGIQTLVALGSIDNPAVMRSVAGGLHHLTTHSPLHSLLVSTGAVKAICFMLERAADNEEQLLSDGISALMIICKSPDLKAKALQDGALKPVLRLCTLPTQAIALIAVSTLTLMAENPATHQDILEAQHKTLARILALTASSDETMQEVALKTVAQLSNGSDWHRHRIVQEDFSAGRNLEKVLQGMPRNRQILCNAACLVANLASSAEDQSGLRDLLTCMCSLLTSDLDNNGELLRHVARGLANFAAFSQNCEQLLPLIPAIVRTCVRSDNSAVRAHGLRALVSLLALQPARTAKLLLEDGAGDLLEGLVQVPGMTSAITSALLFSSPEREKPS